MSYVLDKGTAMFAGLNDESYDSLKMSIDGINYIPIERDNANLYHSKPIDFSGLEIGVLYKVFGRFSVNNVANDIECNALSQDGIDEDVFDIEAIKNNATQISQCNAQPLVEVG